MKKHIVLTLLVVALGLGASAQSFAVKQSSYQGVTLQFSAPKLHPQTFKHNADRYAVLYMEGFGSTGAIGTPSLPELVKLVELPLGGKAVATVVEADYDTLPASVLGITLPVMPQQPSRSKSDTSPFVLHKDAQAYATNAFYGNAAVTVKNIGVSRDRNLAEVHYMPLRYNPVTGQMIFCKSVTVAIRTQNANIAATMQMKSLHHSNAFGSATSVANRLDNGKAVNRSAPIHYLIVAHSMFRGKLDDFIAWKRRQGMIVTVGYTDDANVGTTASSIKAYIKGFYTNATQRRPAPTYVLLVGDKEQIPESMSSSQAGYAHISDLQYFTWTDDNLPDCYYGRFSAQNEMQLTPQVEKTLMYEQYTFPDDNFLSRAALIAGVDGGYESDNAYRYCDPTMDYVAKYYVNGSHGYDTVSFYKNNTNQNPSGASITGSSQSNSASNQLLQFYNDGFGWVSYSAHGDIDQWYQPNITNSNVSQMSNEKKFGVMIGNCCLTNHFNTDECFGEALLRKDGYKGAVSYVGGSNVTYWYEDFCWAVGMRSNSVINNSYDAPYIASQMGAYDRLFHTHGEDFSDWNISMGSIIHAGNMAVQSSSSSLANYYWQIYHLMGDPSLMPWLGKAQTMAVDAPSTMLSSLTALSVNVPPYSYVALTNGDSLIAAAYADGTGNATLGFEALVPGTSAQLAVTAQNYKPFFQDINVVSPNGPYVVVDSIDAVLTSGKVAAIDLHLTNVGTATATNIGVQVSVNGSHLLNLAPMRRNYPSSYNLASHANATIDKADSVRVWPTVADGTSTTIAATVYWTSGDETKSFTRTFHKTVSSPALAATMSTEGNVITIDNANSGSSPFGSGTATLVSASPELVITNASVHTAAINTGESEAVQFQVTAASTLPSNYNIPLEYTVTDGSHTYHAVFNYISASARTTETFESGDFSSFSWNQGAMPWQIDSTTCNNGRHSARSYDFGSNGSEQISALNIQWNSTIDDTISFYRKVSSEASYDLFRFYIDGTVKHEASGEEGWKRIAFPVSAGTHTFSFIYEKDYSMDGGSDCAWIDDVRLPSNTNDIYLFDTICQGSNYEIADSTLATAALPAGNYGYSVAKDNVTYHVALAIRAIPAVAISASKTSVQSGEAVRLVASGADRYVWNTGEAVPELHFVPTATHTYSVTGYNGICTGTASVKVMVDGINGIGDVDNAPRIALYPNPATDHVSINSALPIRSADLYNVQGQLVAHSSASSGSLSFSLEGLGKGFYLMKVALGDGSSQTLKVVKR